ncbi:hypothetical protein [Treponema pedis]|nr:hypothetical protein [Treponema pedis]
MEPNMNSMEKFYSDANRLIKTCEQTEFYEELSSLFCRAAASYDKRITVLAKDFADYGFTIYGNDKQPKEDAVEWFYKIFSLLAGSFETDMDFSDEDWEQINLIVSAEAGETDMDLLNTVMAVMVERKKI